MDDSQFSAWQSHLVTLLGVSVDELRAIRKKILVENEDWRLIANRVCFNPEAVKKIKAALLLPPPASSVTAPPCVAEAPEPADVPAIPEKTPGEGASARPLGAPAPRVPILLGPGRSAATELIVYRTVANPQIVEAYLEGTDPADRANILRVRVRSSANFTRLMRIPVRMVQEPDLFEFTGRLPRWKGKM